MSILNVEHLSHGFGDRAIFEDVSFRLLRGEHIGLVGANGEGKSTFMSIVTHRLQPDEGKIEWSKNVRAGYLDQHAVLEPGMTIQDVLRSAFAWLFGLEEQMKNIIGSKVAIRTKANGKGKIEIEYYSTDDLERIMELFQQIQK